MYVFMRKLKKGSFIPMYVLERITHSFLCMFLKELHFYFHVCLRAKKGMIFFMNLCFLAGKIYSDIDFNFIMKGKNYSIAQFILELFDGTLVYLNAYDDVADYLYSKFKKEDVIFCEATLRSDEIVCQMGK